MASPSAEKAEQLSPADLREAWALLEPSDRLHGFRSLRSIGRR